MLSCKLENIFTECKVSFIQTFCTFNYLLINYSCYQDETGIRFFLYYGKDYPLEGRLHFTPDNGFTYYVYYLLVCIIFSIHVLIGFTGLKKLVCCSFKDFYTSKPELKINNIAPQFSILHLIVEKLECINEAKVYNLIHLIQDRHVFATWQEIV